MKRKVVLAIILILYCILIFWFSHQDADVSSAMSDGVISSFTDLEEDFISDELSFIVRKSAHLFVYLGLGVISYLFICEFTKKRLVLYSFLFGFIYAISDEIHQTLIPGRSGQISDVLLDSVGVLIGILIIRFILRKKSK